MKSPCCSDVICMSTAGSGYPDGTRICAKCGKAVDHIVDANKMPPVVQSFYEPKSFEPESPKIEGYSVGEDAECMPGHKEPKTVGSEPTAGIPERYRDPKNKMIL